MNLFDIIRLNVEFFFEDVEEIGSSDVSCCVNAVINDYAPLTTQYASTPTRREIRRAVNAAISDFLPDDWPAGCYVLQQNPEKGFFIW